MDNLFEEANAFDRQIEERVNNGHIPDLRRSGKCEYFYNNVWRDQYYANLYYGELVKKIIVDIKRNFNKPLEDVTLLEVGCGPGHVCLELSRNGINTTGLDISSVCIKIANDTAETDPFINERGQLRFLCSDFLQLRKKFDVIIFTASLHHFPNCNEIISYAQNLLNDNGLIIADEPIRDHVDKKNAAVILLIKTLLSATNSYYKKNELPLTIDDCKKSVDAIYHEEKYEMEDGSKVQSVNDNEATFNDMYSALTSQFKELFFEKKYAIYHQIIGGIRLENESDEHELALFIKIIDGLLCEYDAVNPTNFYFLGQKNKFSSIKR